MLRRWLLPILLLPFFFPVHIRKQVIGIRSVGWCHAPSLFRSKRFVEKDNDRTRADASGPQRSSTRREVFAGPQFPPHKRRGLDAVP